MGVGRISYRLTAPLQFCRAKQLHGIGTRGRGASFGAPTPFFGGFLLAVQVSLLGFCFLPEKSVNGVVVLYSD